MQYLFVLLLLLFQFVAQDGRVVVGSGDFDRLGRNGFLPRAFHLRPFEEVVLIYFVRNRTFHIVFEQLEC